MRISDWSSDVCSSDLLLADALHLVAVAVGELRPALGGQALHPADPARIELTAEVVVEEFLAVDAAALGHAQHLALVGQQAAVQAVELVDKLLPIGRAACRTRVWQYG